MLIRLAELLQYDPQKVAELSCMSGICHVMEQMTLDRVFRCKSRHWTDFASICGLNRLVESGGGFSLLILLIGSTRSATGLRQRLQRLISAESLADPRGKTFQPWAQQAVSPWGELVEVVRENFTYYISLSYCIPLSSSLVHFVICSVAICYYIFECHIICCGWFWSFHFSFPMICSGPVDHVLLFLFLFYISEFPFNDGNFWCSLIC